MSFYKRQVFFLGLRFLLFQWHFSFRLLYKLRHIIMTRGYLKFAFRTTRQLFVASIQFELSVLLLVCLVL